MSNEVSNNSASIVQKHTIRQLILAERAQKSHSERSLHDAKLLGVITEWLQQTIHAINAQEHVQEHKRNIPRNGDSGLTVAAFIPVGDEPGATLGQKLLNDIQKTIGAGTLLLPVCPPGPPAALEWGVFTGSLTSGKYGLLEPDCIESDGPLPPKTIAKADIILIPGVAGDALTGMRMGRGAGYYDRSLALISDELPPTALVLHPNEVIEGVPYDAHDKAVDVILTANGALKPRNR